MVINKTPKNPSNFSCLKCNFKCSNKKDYNRHIMTAKHKMIMNDNQKNPKTPLPNVCLCGKKFKFPSGLSRHKNKCSQNNNSNTIVVQENQEEKPSMMDFITQNKEIMDLLVAQNKEIVMQNKEQAILIKEQADTIRELIPKIGNNNTTTNNNTNNNSTYRFF